MDLRHIREAHGGFAPALHAAFPADGPRVQAQRHGVRGHKPGTGFGLSFGTMLQNTSRPLFDPAEGIRRMRPSPWHHDYLLMTRALGAFSAMLRAHVPETGNLQVVDYGCGDAPYRPLFAGIAEKYVTADIEENASAEVHLDSDGGLPLPSESADVVMSAQVLEHVPDPSFYLRECFRVLKHAGVLLLSTHGTWPYHPHPGDFRRWTRSGLTFDISQAGFSVVETRACLGPLAYTTQLHLLLLRGVAKALGRFGEVACAPFFLLGQGLMAIEDCITPSQVLEDNACVYVVAARRA